MRFRPVRGLRLTVFGLGGASLGNLYRETTDDQAHSAVDAAWAGGIRYFDTAPHYGLGPSERRLGAALAGRPLSEYVLSTKVGRLLEPNPTPTGSDLAAGGFAVPDDLVRRFDFGADATRRSLESSLERLGVDRVDVVYVHDPDLPEQVDAALDGALPALVRLRDDGVVGAIGVGMNQWEALLRIVRSADVDVVMLAGRWTLLDRSGGPLLEECAARSVAVVAAAPYNSGLLAADRPRPDAMFDYAPVPAAVHERATWMADTCAAHGVHLPAVALQFPLRSPAVASVVASIRTPEQVSSTLARLSEPVPEGVWAAFDA